MLRELTKREIINAKLNGNTPETVIGKDITVVGLSFVTQEVTNLETGEREPGVVSFILLENGDFITSPSPYLREALSDISDLCEDEQLTEIKLRIVKRKAKRTFYSAIIVD